jgi:tRNA threonylcarbamoyladenosine biosynthesis protein TsaE
MKERFEVASEAAMLELGAMLAARLTDNARVLLDGELGAGKTTLARGVLRGLGFEGPVKSPTYTIVEPYEFSGKRVYHFDFYRIEDPRELEFIGLDELVEQPGIKLMEWSQRAGDRLPPADFKVRISTDGDRRTVELEDLRISGGIPGRIPGRNSGRDRG